VRFGLGRHTTDADIDFAIDRLTTVVRSLRTHPVAG
jgi:cysteine sulfinate desulfinase/cysteine desulfurase-like protein